MTTEVFRSDVDGEGLRVGIVQARFNEQVGTLLRDACLEELMRLGVDEEDIFVCTVPGALEIPIALQRLGRSGEFDALIALGAVIRGETYHFEVVSNESAAGIARVQIELSIPIANAVLTTENDAQAEARASVKGLESARVAIEMANLVAALDTLAGQVDDDD